MCIQNSTLCSCVKSTRRKCLRLDQTHAADFPHIYILLFSEQIHAQVTYCDYGRNQS